MRAFAVRVSWFEVAGGGPGTWVGMVSGGSNAGQSSQSRFPLEIEPPGLKLLIRLRQLTRP